MAFAPWHLGEGLLATRGRTTFRKRQKELERKEKQRLKAERRAQRKLARDSGQSGAEEATPSSDWGSGGESQNF